MKQLLILTILMVTQSCTTAHRSKYYNQQIKINEIFEKAHEDGMFNGNVLVTKSDDVVYQISFGDVDASGKLKLVANHKFGLGSIYKEFPAVATMQLVEKGLLKLDVPINKYLPELPEWSKGIYIEHLLRYSSGLPRVQFGKHKNISDKNVFDDLLQLKTLSFTPGSGYLYSNNNPLLLIKIIERVTGDKFSSYAGKNIFSVAQMKATYLEKQYPYINRNSLAIPFKENSEDQFPVRLSALFVSTANDLNSWLKALHSGKLISANSLKYLSRKSKSSATNKESPLGQIRLKNNKVVSHQHHGSMGNYEAIIKSDNMKAVNVIILSNTNHSNVQLLADEVLKTFNSKLD